MTGFDLGNLGRRNPLPRGDDHVALEDRVAYLEGLLAAGLALQPGDYPVALVRDADDPFYPDATEAERVTLRILPWNTEEEK